MPNQKSKAQQFADYWGKVNAALDELGEDHTDGMRIMKCFRRQIDPERVADMILMEEI